MQRQFKLGFIGGGLNSAVGRTHAIASQMDNRWKVVCGAFSRDDAINLATAERLGIPARRAYRGWKYLLEEESTEVDAVVILTPTPQHDEQVKTALQAGFNVICEKALSRNAATAAELARHADRYERFLAVTYNYSGYPMVRELQTRIKAGEFGRILAVHVEMPQEGFLRLSAEGNPIQPQSWRRSDDVVPTVSLDLGTHTHHLLQFLLGTNPIELVATQSHHGRVGFVTDYVNCIARYPDGVDVSMWFGKSALGYRNGLRVRVFGADGSAEWHQMNPEELRIADAMANVRVIDRASPGCLEAGKSRYERFKAGHPAGFLEAFANLYWDLGDALDEFQMSGSWNTPYVYGAKSAASGLRMLESISRSAQNHSWDVVAGQ